MAGEVVSSAPVIDIVVYRKCDSVSEAAVRLAAEVYRDLKNVEPGVQLTAVH